MVARIQSQYRAQHKPEYARIQSKLKYIVSFPIRGPASNPSHLQAHRSHVNITTRHHTASGTPANKTKAYVKLLAIFKSSQISVTSEIRPIIPNTVPTI